MLIKYSLTIESQTTLSPSTLEASDSGISVTKTEIKEAGPQNGEVRGELHPELEVRQD